jgi:UDP-N-acetylglucosamine:LPS N-acetylglucosamine transferase
VPGQEKGNAEFVTGAGAGVYAPRPRQLAAEVGRLRRDPGALAAMRDAAVRLSRPRAATDIARFLAGLSGFLGPADQADGEQAARDLLSTLIAD